MNYNEIEKLKSIETKIYSGIPAAPGYAIGPVLKYEKEKIEIFPSVTLDTDSEIETFKYAIDKSKKELQKIIDFSRDKIDDKMVEIFEAHLLILDDMHLLDSIKNNILQKKHSAEYSVEFEFNKYIEQMRKTNDPAMIERSNDIEDIKFRIIRNLQRKRWESILKQSVIIVAKNLTPADTILFTRNDVLAYVSEAGGLTSHAAIIARALNIPAVLGIHGIFNELQNDDFIIVDGFEGLVIQNPSPETLTLYKNKIEEYNAKKKKYAKLSNIKCKTKDNHQVKLLANIDFLDEIPFAIASGAKGVGLFRTENLFFQKGSFPSESEQMEAYLDLVEKFYPNTVTIRAFDLGGDKIKSDESYYENNPFLGWRGIRLLLDLKNIFKTQLRAILRSSIYKNVRVMIPMVSSIDEIIEAKKILEEVKDELRFNRIKFDESIKFGIMAEVPSIIYCLKEASKYIDFVSVGTNDLTQYLLAVDRGNERVFKSYQEFHPALIRSLRQVTKELNRTKVEVGICGELASNIKAVPLLLGLGYNVLSVNEYLLPEIKKTILNLKLSECKKLAVKCLRSQTQAEIIEIIEEFNKNLNNNRS